MTHRIIVLGAGYTGATAAGRLARRLHRDDVTITLVNAEPDFVERVRLHQVATGQQLTTRPLSEMFSGTGVAIRLAQVTAIDVACRTVTVASVPGSAVTPAEDLPYDTLVYALGSRWTSGEVPGAAEHAHQVASRDGALRLRDRLAGLTGRDPVVVVGGGLTGIEVATEIAEARQDLEVSLVVAGVLGNWLSPTGRRHLRRVVDRLGITIVERSTVTEVAADRVTLDGASAMPAAVTVWTTGFAVHPLAATTPLATADNGQVVVDDTMRSISHPEVYVVGDAARVAGPGGRPLRMSCASGVPTAWQAADAIAARLTSGRVPRVPLRYLNQCISLGRRDGLIQYVTADDRSVAAALTGPIAARYKEAVCAGAAWGVAHPTLGLPVRTRRVTVPPVQTAVPPRPASGVNGSPVPLR